ncbi:MAG TPA: DUF2071 domain-containing protein [Chryseolinea sp.]|nr:DUF2071 domain-containing protein [Chryseolinea sp.]
MKTFLKAEWRKLALANYAIDPSLLLKYVPAKTELDLWNNKCYVSLVGFMFLNTSIKGFRIPYHVNFEEVNLRFYVTYNDAGRLKRGVVFIKEIVPRAALTLVANTVYGENYQTLPMRHHWQNGDDSLKAEYYWKLKQKWNSIKVVAEFNPQNIVPASEEEFVTEHYWGYTKINATTTSEYEVEHPRWVVYPVKNYHVDVEFGDLYGKEFHFLKSEEPVSVFLAEGSEIAVKSGLTLSR